MKLLQIKQRVKNLLSRLSTVERQWAYFDWQKIALQEIKMYDWYRYIVEYREQQADNAMNMLANPETPKELISYRQAMHNSAIQFLDFLNYLNKVE